MSSNQNGSSCRTTSWGAAIVLGLIGVFLALNWLGWGLFWSLIAGIVVFFVLGFLLVSMLCGADEASAEQAPAPETAPKPAPAPEPVAEVAKAPAAASDAGGKPAMLDGPRDNKADDLKKIKGVGPGLEKALNEMGVFHFDQMAGWTASEVAWVDENLLRFKGRATRDNWVDQAKTLAGGGDTEFSNRVKKGDVY